MKTPTLEEVKEYFKNAKEVRCLSSAYKGELRDISKVESFDIGGNEIWFDLLDSTTCKVWDEYEGYAEIVSYIEPQFTLTKEQLSYLHSIDSVTETIEEWFPSEFPELESGKYLKDNSQPKWLIFVDNNKIYGIDVKGNWFVRNNDIYVPNKQDRYATPQEVEEALTKEAVKRGYKEGVVCLFGNAKDKRKILSKHFNYDNDFNSLSIGYDIIFKDGIWAEIVSEPIEVTIEEIDKLKGVDVSLIKIVK